MPGAIERSRGTGPRSLSVDCDRQIANGSRSGDLELQVEVLSYRRAGACPPPGLGQSNVREGQALALRGWGDSLLSHVREGQALALRGRDDSLLSHVREGQALALR